MTAALQRCALLRKAELSWDGLYTTPSLSVSPHNPGKREWNASFTGSKRNEAMLT